MSKPETARELIDMQLGKAWWGDPHKLQAASELARRVERVLARVERVLALHTEYRIYDECGHEHQEGEAGVILIEDVGLVCEEGYLYSICHECATDGGELREDSDEHKWPCPTLRALDGAE